MQKLPRGRENCPQNFPSKAGKRVKAAQDIRAQRQKIRQRAAKDAHEHEQPEHPAPDIEREEQKARRRYERVERIKWDRERFAQPSCRAKGVIQYAKGETQKKRRGKFRALQPDRKLHQPNRRAKKPAALVSSS